jgi:hypothetical protein
MGRSPAWANLPRRKCDDCGTEYKPKRPLLKDQRGFCSDNCRKSYHKHGGAYRKLKGEMEKMIQRRFVALELDLGRRLREIVREDIQNATVRRAVAEHISASLSPGNGDPLPRATPATGRKGIQD